MRVTGARVAVSASESVFRDLEFEGDSQDLDVTGQLILPGLINSHDHLEFALFPKLGTKVYRNATEWAQDVYRPTESPVREHREIPKANRLMWGGLRNLLSGVTTVAHHNLWDEATFAHNFPVRVVQDLNWAHSLEFEPGIVARHRPGQPFVIHAAEGTDELARAEIVRLRELGLLTADTVLVHAISLGEQDLPPGCAIVFCPNSNLETYGQTLPLETLRSGIPIALGSDSPITFAGDLRDDIRTAHELGLTAAEVYQMVTSAPQTILRLTDRGDSDFVAVRDEGQTPAEAILTLRPELVVIGGKVKLSGKTLPGLEPIRLNDEPTFWVDAPVRNLLREAHAHLGPTVRLAGKVVTQ